MPVHKWHRRQTEHFGEVWAPIASIRLQSSGGSFQKLALQIDTGAVVSLLRRSVADLLGIDIASGRPLELTSVSGGKTKVYVHEILTQFDDNIVLPVPFAISSTESVPNLLGRLGVFDHLQFDFDPTLDEVRISAPWLDKEGRRIYEFLIDTEKHILARLISADIPEQIRRANERFLNRGELLLASGLGLVKLHRAYPAPLFIRTMLELSMQFEYLMQKPEERAEQYLEYEHVARHKLIKAILDNPSGPIGKHLAASPLRCEGEPKVEAEYSRVRSRFTFTDRKGRKRLADKWYCMTVANLAKSIGRLDEYRVIYRTASAWTHADPFSTQGTLPYAGHESQVISVFCTAYYARMLLQTAEHCKIILSSEQYTFLAEFDKNIS